MIHKALTQAGSLIFNEIGTMGAGDNNDVMTQVDAFLEESVSKGVTAESISKADQVTAFFAQNPEAYDQYRLDQSNR